MAYQTKPRGPSPRFNPISPTVMHLDLNSAFATMEQQANPLLRGVPLVVAASSKSFGCILASSREAKLWNVKTGMSVQEGRERCPFLVVREADPNKYRHIHQEIKSILDSYSDIVLAKSIDEFVINFPKSNTSSVLIKKAKQIQQEIKSRVGEHLTVSVGIAPTRFLAKLGSDLKRPDPFIIDVNNYLLVYNEIKLTDFSGINHRLASRLREQGIYTPLDFFAASEQKLKSAFRSVLSRDWYLRLHGWELDNKEVTRRTFGQSYVLPHPMGKTDWLPIMHKLTHKAARRMRMAGYSARGVHLYLRFKNRSSWHKGKSLATPVFQSSTLTSSLSALIPPHTPDVKGIAISLFNLSPLKTYQCELFTNTPRSYALTSAIDSLNTRYGPYCLHQASMLGSSGYVRDAISFGK